MHLPVLVGKNNESRRRRCVEAGQGFLRGENRPFDY